MTNPKFFKNPFGISGDRTPVPDDILSDGSVNYSGGWTSPYSENPETSLTAKLIPREQMNQILYEITAVLQQYQLSGVAWWEPPATTGIAYSKAALVMYAASPADPAIYQSLNNGNFSTPTSSQWVRLRPENHVPTGAVFDCPFSFAPDGYLIMAGQVLNKVIFSSLWAVVQSTARIVTDDAWHNSGDYGTFSDVSATQFRLPDPRGVFIRTYDNGRGVDLARNLGDAQSDAIINHYHRTSFGFDNNNFYGWQDASGFPHYGSEAIGPVSRTRVTADGEGGVNVRIGYTENNSNVSGETRPANIAWNKIIKY